MNTQFEIQKLLENEVNFASERIREAENLTEEHSRYFGITDVIFFCKTCEIIDEKTFIKYRNITEKAHNEYFSKLSDDLQSVHKRMF